MLPMPRIESGGDVPSDASSKAPHCHACKAELLIGQDRCWLCGAAIGSGSEATPSNRPAATSFSTSGRPVRFSLATLMMLMTLAAIVCGVYSIAPGIGMIMALVLLPVMTLAVISVRRVESLGNSLGHEDRIMMFFGSLSLVVVAGIAASIAFGITCFAGFFTGAIAGEALGARGYEGLGWGLAAGLGLGAIGGTYVGYRALVYMSRKSKWRREEMPPLSARSKLILAAAILLAIIGAIVTCCQDF
jgi:hypothetical protein